MPEAVGRAKQVPIAKILVAQNVFFVQLLGCLGVVVVDAIEPAEVEEH